MVLFKNKTLTFNLALVDTCGPFNMRQMAPSLEENYRLALSIDKLGSSRIAITFMLRAFDF